jgi:hypothetical protein
VVRIYSKGIDTHVKPVIRIGVNVALDTLVVAIGFINTL